VFSILTQRKTQTTQYWQEQFQLNNKDTEAIYQQILERGGPVDLGEIALALVRRQVAEEELAARSELQEGKLYQPDQNYAIHEKVIFPALDFAVGTVVATREGRHPEYGTFTVIRVDFDGSSDTVREFAANFEHDHPLNKGGEQSLTSLQGLLSSEEIYQSHKEVIHTRIKAGLDTNDDFVSFHGQYFLRDLLPEFHEGLFNIADAAIDINNGPLSIDALIEQMGLVQNSQEITPITRFSVNYRLANDERFDDVGPKDQVLWYLERMAPPEAHYPPRRLQVTQQDYDPDLFDNDLLDLLAEIDDEATKPEDIEPVGLNTDKITVVLNYPHWRVGTLPLTPKTETFFPTSFYNPVLFQFVDGRTGNKFPGWTVQEHNYVFGLGEWYKRNKLPVGAYITIKRTNDPMQLIVDYQATRTQRDWVRMAALTNRKLTFQMSPAAIGCKYDELMIIGETNSAQIDAAWVSAEERNLPVYDILCDIFPELSKLNPQSTVHAKTLYSVVNLLRRVPPGVVFQELETHRCFIAMNHGYWTYDQSLRD
jgi:hypothetical protein